VDSRILVLISIVGWGLWSYLQKMAVYRLHPIHMQIITYSVGMLLLTFYSTIAYHKVSQPFSISGMWFAILASLCSAIASVSFLFAIRQGNVGIISVLTSTSPLITLLLAFVFLGERLTLLKMFGVLLTIGGVIILAH
jgi:bacterial/archaeal transporter family protein